MDSIYQPCTTRRLPRKLLLWGGAGSGKTYSGLSLLSGVEDVAVLDTEGAAALYAPRFDFSIADVARAGDRGYPYRDVGPLVAADPRLVIAGLHCAVRGGHSALLIDSMSDVWAGTLALVDALSQRGGRRGDSRAAWGAVTPIWRDMLAMVRTAPIAVIMTARAKMATVGDERVAVIDLRDEAEYTAAHMVIRMAGGGEGLVTKSRYDGEWSAGEVVTLDPAMGQRLFA